LTRLFNRIEALQTFAVAKNTTKSKNLDKIYGLQSPFAIETSQLIKTAAEAMRASQSKSSGTV